MRWIPVIVAFAAVVAVAAGPMRQAGADVPLDYEIPNGRFFTQTNGKPGVEPNGYAVTNDGGIPMWQEFQRLGGVTAIGYPISRRFLLDGFTVQAFQKMILQWRPEARQAWPINVLDLLHDRGKDPWLASFRSTPPPLPPEFDGGRPWHGVVAARLALLDANPAIKHQYNSIPDPMTFYGLPVSSVVDNGNHFAIRLQRATIQQWKVDVPWAKAGQATVANSGDLAKEAGVLPKEAVATDLPPWGAGRVVAIDAGHGGAEIGTAYRYADGSTILEKDLNLRVALKVADLLAAAGYKPVLTRTKDTEVNRPPKLLTLRPPIGLDDELQSRIDFVNNSGAKLFLSIHFNGHPDSRLRGSEIYYCKERPFAAESKRFADLLLTHLVRGLATIGYKDDDSRVKLDSQALRPGEHFYLLGPANNIIARPSTMPAALAEGLFVTNALDANTLRVENTLDIIARGYATAIHDYFVGGSSAVLPNAPPLTLAPPTPSPTTTASPTLAPSPTPTPKPSPPALGSGTVGIDFGGGAMLRSEASKSAAVIGAIPNGATVDLLQLVNGQELTPGEARWYRASYDGREGYVYSSLIVRAAKSTPTPSATPTATPVTTPTPVPSPAPKASPPLTQGSIKVDFGDGAILRAEASTAAAVVASIPNGATLDILQAIDGQAVIPGDILWYRARHLSAEGFVYAALVQTVDNKRPPTPSNPQKGVITAQPSATLRGAPTTKAPPVAVLPDDTAVVLVEAVVGEVVLAGTNRWYRVRANGAEGYVYSVLIRQ